MSYKLSSIAASSIAAILLTAVTYAQPQPAPAYSQPAGSESAGAPSDQPDPEDRNHGVARISLLNGDVSVRRGDSGDFVAASVNAPLLSMDSVQTGPASRAEIQFDFANRIRLSEGAEVRLADLRGDHFQVQIARGTTTFAVLADSAAQVEISTPSVSIRPTRRGDYRVAVLEDGTTQVTVRMGEVEIATQAGTQRIVNGQTMLVRGSPTDPEYQTIAAIPRDEWDLFCERRDSELLRATSSRYVSRDIAGAEDLDQYGRWVSDPTYGNVWAPRVAADWAPYQSGRWVWEDYYGWTWVSYDPWGWAPYHYGSWFHGGLGWCWYPGAFYGRHFFSPARVAFFGFGGGFGVGFGFGHIGWVPLGPYEPFHRWWGGGYRGGYGRGFTTVNNVNVTNVYRNARVTNGVTSVSSQQFASGQFGRYSHPGMQQLSQASVMHGGLPVTPTGANLRFNDRQTSVAPRTDFGRQQFFSRNTTAPAQRTPFAQQQQQVQQSFGRQNGFGNSTAPAQQTQQGFGRQSGIGQGAVAQTAPNSGASGNSGWRRFGDPNGSGASRQPSPSTQPFQRQGPTPSSQPSSGWSRFGNPGGGSNQPQIIRGQGPSQPLSQPRQTYQPPSAPSQNYRSAPQQQYYSQPRSFNSEGNSRSLQIAPPIVQQRQQNYSGYSGGNSYHAPSTPSYHSAPAPSYHGGGSTQHSSGGGGSSQHSSGGGGGSHGGGGGRR